MSSQIKLLQSAIINYSIKRQVRKKIKSIAQEIMTLKLICVWIFSQNANTHDYMNLKLADPFSIDTLTQTIQIYQNKVNQPFH